MTEEGDANLLYFPGFEVKEGENEEDLVDYNMNDEVLCYLQMTRDFKLEHQQQISRYENTL